MATYCTSEQYYQCTYGIIPYILRSADQLCLCQCCLSLRICSVNPGVRSSYPMIIEALIDWYSIFTPTPHKALERRSNVACTVLIPPPSFPRSQMPISLVPVGAPWVHFSLGSLSLKGTDAGMEANLQGSIMESYL